MSQILTPQQLCLAISTQPFGFNDTSELINQNSKNAQQLAWVAQADAKNAAEFGLNIQQAGFNLLVLGESRGCSAAAHA
jgi:glycerol dehydrogenase-like iron-containing ADH family enzyme